MTRRWALETRYTLCHNAASKQLRRLIHVYLEGISYFNRIIMFFDSVGIILRIGGLKE